MKIGLNATTLIGRASIPDFVQHALDAERAGFSSYWLAELPTGGVDCLTVLAVVGQSVEHMELGSAIVPTYPRHPLMLAGQALTVQAAIKSRFALGIGMSHKVMMADFGVDDAKPIRHLREYLDVLVPMIREGRADSSGETITGKATALHPTDTPPDITAAALGPQALRVAGAAGVGTNLAWCGPNTIRDHIVPTISDAAGGAGHGPPRVVATLPVCVTDNPDTARTTLTANTEMYMSLPSYQAMFEREGVQTTGELGLIGSEAQIEERIAHLASCGVTDFAASEFGLNSDERARTRQLLSALAATHNTTTGTATTTGDSTT